MNEIRKGDIVTRNSYGNDILFKIKRILKLSNGQKIAILKGVDVRIEADAPIEDLQLATKEEHNRCEKELENRIKSKIKVITYVIALMVRDNIPSNTITRTKLIDIYKLCKNKQIEYENTNKEISDFISYYYKSVINSGKKNEI